jgi:hypothetical protein
MDRGCSVGAAHSHGPSPSSASSSSDTITVLYAEWGFAAKTLSRDSNGALHEKGNSAGRWYHANVYVMHGLADLAAVIDVVQRHPKAVVIRGAPLAHVNLQDKVRRMKNTFRTPVQGRHWIMVDFDKIKLPNGLALRKDVAQVVEYLIQQLPPEFHQASYYWQLSAKAGFTPDDVVSMHIWFWLSKPTTDKCLKDWANGWNEKAGAKLIDPALFCDVQPHYTSAPILVGLVDPFPVRSGFVQQSSDTVDLVPLRSAGKRNKGTKKGTKLGPHGGALDSPFKSRLGEIGDHKGGGGFHVPIIRAAASYVATRPEDEIDIDELKSTLREAILAADRRGHPDEYVEQMASDEHLDSAISSAIDKFAQPGRVHRKPKTVDGIPPHYEHKPVAVEKAAGMLSAALSKFFATGVRR